MPAPGLLTLREAFCSDDDGYFRDQPPCCQQCGDAAGWRINASGPDNLSRAISLYNSTFSTSARNRPSSSAMKAAMTVKPVCDWANNPTSRESHKAGARSAGDRVRARVIAVGRQRFPSQHVTHTRLTAGPRIAGRPHLHLRPGRLDPGKLLRQFPLAGHLADGFQRLGIDFPGSRPVLDVMVRFASDPSVPAWIGPKPISKRIVPPPWNPSGSPNRWSGRSSSPPPPAAHCRVCVLPWASNLW